MNPTPEDISAGQKAYRGLIGYERFRMSQRSKLSLFLNVFALLFMVAQILAWSYEGNFWRVAAGVGTVGILIWGFRVMEVTKRKNFELLRQLKTKYGLEIYDEIKKEPDPLQYKLFQKSYQAERKPLSIDLP